MSQISRRDFLNVAGIGIASALATGFLRLPILDNHDRPNIIIILCDALSASHLSLHGYPRLTTPNIDAFALRSTVYHNHYSGGNFTTTGTASMLTGMHAWKHRALNFGGLIHSDYIHINPYTVLGNEYSRLIFSQNVWSDRLVGQFYKDVDRFLSPTSYSKITPGPIEREFENDPVLASIAVSEFLLPEQGTAPAGSSLLGYLYKSTSLDAVRKQVNVRYPNGLPEVQMSDGYVIPYLNDDIYNGLYSELSRLESTSAPYFAYFHLYSPHYPYRPRGDYRSSFRNDGYKPVAKPDHPFSEDVKMSTMLAQRTLYDGLIAQIDNEFGKLISRLDENRILDNSYLIVTSDHGELFERGYVGHGNQLMYEPVIRIPLLIHAPHQAARQDIFSLTSNIDILPTILSVAGKELPVEMDGKVLPGMGGTVDEDRPIFSALAKENSAFAPLKKAVISMRKRNYKLIAYLGYDNFDQVYELYDLENDPDELVDLSSRDSGKLKPLKEELLANLEKANRPFEKK
jgi:arylsulfatase A-like enzyme